MTAESIDAQSIYNQSPSQIDVPDAHRQLNAERADLSLSPLSPSYIPPTSFLDWGPVKARPHLSTLISYGNGLRSQSGGDANTLIEQVSPGVLFELGSKWRLDYTPTMSFYSSKEFKDTLAHSVSLSGGTTYQDWSFGLSQSYYTSSQPLIETGRQTEQESFDTSFSAARHFNSKLLLELGLTQSFRSAQEYTGSRSWSTMDWLNYQISPSVSVAAGLGGGYDNLDVGSDMAFEQVQGRINVRVAEKLTLSINAGGESRQVLDLNGDPLINPIYGASILYYPFQFTTLSLSGNRAVSASLLQGQINESSGISLALSQRLLGIFYTTLSGGFRKNHYIQSDNAFSLDRADDTVSFAAHISYGFTQGGTIALFYNHNENTSTASGFGLSSSQIGLEFTYRF